MGEVLLLDVARCADWPAEIDVLHAAGFETWALTPDPQATNIWELDVPAVRRCARRRRTWPHPWHEAARASRRVRIPISPAVDSINVGHAAAIAFAIAANRSANREPGCRGDDGTRTHNPHLAKVVRYQLRHVPGGSPGYRLVVFGGDGVRGDVHLRLVLGEVDHPALGPEAVTQRRAALVARAVEALLHASAAPGTGHLDRLHVSDASHPSAAGRDGPARNTPVAGNTPVGSGDEDLGADRGEAAGEEGAQGAGVAGGDLRPAPLARWDAAQAGGDQRPAGAGRRRRRVEQFDGQLAPADESTAEDRRRRRVRRRPTPLADGGGPAAPWRAG